MGCLTSDQHLFSPHPFYYYLIEHTGNGVIEVITEDIPFLDIEFSQIIPKEIYTEKCGEYGL